MVAEIISDCHQGSVNDIKYASVKYVPSDCLASACLKPESVSTPAFRQVKRVESVK